jgi:hypothetical protein
MTWLRTLARRAGPAEQAPAPFAFCEPSWATTRSRTHIRRVGPEGLRLGGGVPDPALCGAALHHGWDLPTPIDPARLDRLVDWHVNPVCRDCADRWKELTA